MLIVTTHRHDLVHWFEPVEMLVHQMHPIGVDKATPGNSEGKFDNRSIMEHVQRVPGRFSAVGLVDTDSANAPETLTRLVSEGAQGVRLSPPTWSPGYDPLAIWRNAAELVLPVGCLSSSEGFTLPLFMQGPRNSPACPLLASI
jgi:L-fuconolactonase